MEGEVEGEVEGRWRGRRVCVGGVKSCSEIILAPTYTFDHTTSIHVSLSALSLRPPLGVLITEGITRPELPLNPAGHTSY